MIGERGNSLVVIENGRLSVYCLDDQLTWEVGRLSKGNRPDIQMCSTTVSRKHGCFQNLDGTWFYVDHKGRNGTICNGRRVTFGISGRTKPVNLHHGDVLIFGGGEEAVINSKTVWTVFLEKRIEAPWRTENTKGLRHLTFSNNMESVSLADPEKGIVIEKQDGIAIYMGDITYLAGNMEVTAG
ncbi:MAG: FHA domain-containing protein [Lachnospiraceae bacterium]|nr:FHA domain-containing protein [Lachnospiraceae bacterium]